MPEETMTCYKCGGETNGFECPVCERKHTTYHQDHTHECGPYDVSYLLPLCKKCDRVDVKCTCSPA